MRKRSRAEESGPEAVTVDPSPKDPRIVLDEVREMRWSFKYPLALAVFAHFFFQCLDATGYRSRGKPFGPAKSFDELQDALWAYAPSIVLFFVAIMAIKRFVFHGKLSVCRGCWGVRMGAPEKRRCHCGAESMDFEEWKRIHVGTTEADRANDTP